MNQVVLIGRLTKDPQVSTNPTSQMSVAKFSVAIDRGGDKGADYPNVVCFGKTAELVEKYLGKGRLVGIQGRIQSGSYEKDGVKHYTTDVIADRVEFLDKGNSEKKEEPKEEKSSFIAISDDDIPF